MQNKNENISRTKKVFNIKQKAFSIIFKMLSAARNCLRLERTPLKVHILFTIHLIALVLFYQGY